MHRIEWPASPADRLFALNVFDAIDPEHTALIVIDMQVAFLEQGYLSYGPHALDIVPNINRLASAMRQARGIVVFTRHTTVDDDPAKAPPSWQLARPELAPYFDSLRASDPGHVLHTALDVRPEDLVIDKVRYSAFLPLSSTIDADLRARGIDTVIITGTVTNICCESSARDAHMLGYRVFFISDATAAPTDAAHNASLAIVGTVFADVRTTNETLPLLRVPMLA
jgi:nicotinamidase-related amidase